MPKWIDLTNKKINSITIIDGNLPNDRVNVLGRCDCGVERLFNKNNLLQSRTKNCGEGSCHNEFKDLLGKKFGYLLVIKLKGKHPKRNINVWECQCICGKVVTSYSDRLINSNTSSCGCKRIELATAKTIKPDHAAHKTQVWYQYVGHAKAKSRGFFLTREEFDIFITDKCHYCNAPANLSSNKITNGIDRIDNSIGYVKENCVTACKNCNYAKKEMSYKDFINLCRSVADNFKGKKLYESHRT